jgi:hypothetical protein
MSDDDDRLRRLQDALKVAERVGNTFLAANIRHAIKEHLGGSGEGIKTK